MFGIAKGKKATLVNKALKEIEILSKLSKAQNAEDKARMTPGEWKQHVKIIKSNNRDLINLKRNVLMVKAAPENPQSIEYLKASLKQLEKMKKIYEK